MCCILRISPPPDWPTLEKLSLHLILKIRSCSFTFSFMYISLEQSIEQVAQLLLKQSPFAFQGYDVLFG